MRRGILAIGLVITLSGCVTMGVRASDRQEDALFEPARPGEPVSATQRDRRCPRLPRAVNVLLGVTSTAAGASLGAGAVAVESPHFQPPGWTQSSRDGAAALLIPAAVTLTGAGILTLVYCGTGE
ncbi:MAG TPA: hypothetical protein VH208_09105 [Myxococcaceae bacterium]|nr:hypothetical protein [Myxococcaceae bacterium]